MILEIILFQHWKHCEFKKLHKHLDKIDPVETKLEVDLAKFFYSVFKARNVQFCGKMTLILSHSNFNLKLTVTTLEVTRFRCYYHLRKPTRGNLHSVLAVYINHINNILQ